MQNIMKSGFSQTILKRNFVFILKEKFKLTFFGSGEKFTVLVQRNMMSNEAT